MKKLKVTLLIVMVLLVCVFTSKSYAAISCNVNLTASKTQVAIGEEFSVRVSISNLEAPDGIIALGAVLDYDKTALTLVDTKGVENGKWGAPSYGSKSGKITATRSSVGTTDEAIFEIIFKVNENAGNSAEIKISDLTLSGGSGNQNVGGNSITVKIGTTSQTNPPDSGDNQGGTTGGNNNQSGNTSGNTGSNNNQSGSVGGNTTDSNNNQSGNVNENTNNATQGGTTSNKPSTNNSSSSANKNGKIPQLGLKNIAIITLLTIGIACVTIFGMKLLVIKRKIRKNK